MMQEKSYSSSPGFNHFKLNDDNNNNSFNNNSFPVSHNFVLRTMETLLYLEMFYAQSLLWMENTSVAGTGDVTAYLLIYYLLFFCCLYDFCFSL